MPDAQPDIEQMAVMMQSLGFELTTLEGTPDSISKAVRHSVVSIPTSVHAADSTQYVKYAYDHLLHGNRDSYSSIDTINTVPRTSVSSPQQQQRKQEQQQQHHNNTSANGLSFSHINSLVQKWGGRDALKGLSVNNVSSKFVNSATPELSFCDVYLQSPSTVSLVRKADWYICYSSSDSLFLDLLDGIRMFFVDQGMGLTEDVTVWLDVFSCPLRMQTTRRDPSFVDACLKDIPNMLLLLHPWNDPTSVKSAWNLYEIHAFARRQKNIKIAFMSEQEAALFANALVDNPLDVYNQLKLNVAAASVGTVPKLSHKQLEDIKLSVILVLEEWLIQQLDDGLEQASSHNNPIMKQKKCDGNKHSGSYTRKWETRTRAPLTSTTLPPRSRRRRSPITLFLPFLPSGNGRKRGTIPSNSLEAPLLLLESVSLHASLHSQEPHYFTLFNTLGNIHLKLAPVTTSDSAVSARASAAAITAFRLALGWTTQHLPIDSLQSLTVQFNLGTAYIIAQDFVNAERVLTQCHDVCKYTLGKQDPRTIESFHSLLLVQSRRSRTGEQELLDHVHRVEKVFGGEGGHVMAMEARSMMKKKYRGGSSSSSKLLEMSPTKREEMESFRKDTIKMYSGWYGSRTHVLVLREWIEWA
ncbi:hypothetical protein BDR26DRAFT_1012032 [Obelidium mucronatum]|nr:hypothetical protein BDR26DRAFT_1012032 [Obelidium mucronatum]